MFSANENIALRQHKRRVTEYVESTIPGSRGPPIADVIVISAKQPNRPHLIIPLEEALDKGTTVMVMQVTCRQPGCVPLETASESPRLCVCTSFSALTTHNRKPSVTIVFPRPPRKKKKRSPKEANDPPKVDEEQPAAFPEPLVKDLESSRIGGSFKTRILMPLSEVKREDVLDALPPNFQGGRKTIESLCLKARDVCFAQIGQLVGVDNTEDNIEDRKRVARYLRDSLSTYLERECVPPEWGEPWSKETKDLLPRENLVETIGKIESLQVNEKVGDVSTDKSTLLTGVVD
ncbi:hypothetical protein THAOC_28905 [Thalassiosira oceanica]|uniref:Uncharacterized protein n=1 Tax=Thalassiosira oceanica TaxID=159749 RepID=K0RYY9_THAOC|nr:hypothetical protein THAOC_28905 [Thalassiosira oceanica]|eukprot:EJK51882.1 hypothetical protein THAOC_28905 [Thalassiosira oceanica]